MKKLLKDLLKFAHGEHNSIRALNTLSKNYSPDLRIISNNCAYRYTNNLQMNSEQYSYIGGITAYCALSSVHHREGGLGDVQRMTSFIKPSFGTRVTVPE